MNDKVLPPEDDDRPDPALRRALENAPDHSAVPDFRIGKAIRRMAHQAVAPDEGAQDLLPMLPDGQPLWRRLLFGSGGKTRMPWNAAFASVLVGVLVTVLWQREPVPGPQLDSQAPAAAKSAAPAAAPQLAQPGASAPAAAPSIALPPTVTEAPSLPGPRTPLVVPDLPFQMNLPPPPAAPAPSRSETMPPASARKNEPRGGMADETERGGAPLARQSAPAPAPAVAAAPPAPASPPIANDAAVAGAPDRRAAARMREEAAPPAASAGAVAGAGNQAKSSSSVRTEASEPPSFAALSQWTRMTIVPANGPTRSFTRAEARDLGTLLGSAALSAVSPLPLRSKVEWRVTLERDGKPLAQFELARGEVRWRENGAPAATGQPPEGALDGLRDALREVTAPPAPAAAELQPGAPR
ncbi:hypothetical protein [Variovorax fucosicus]|uniref:hypothetical protein n=1 Tax=Variovorax fucosicus TaxID=3053517 RepID=UPI00257746E2|nr:hypothetical protein [Variovorax sp. J22G47]MDM0054382.1 hypothetical protein [Variovorax sp. J22G47]